MPALEVRQNRFHGRNFTCTHQSNELTALCPETARPDFYNVTIRYSPSKTVVELRSLKLYLQSFRNQRILHEELANEIFEALEDTLRPKRLEVVLDVYIRGGIRTTVSRSSSEGGE